MDLFEAIRIRASIRNLAPVDIPDKDLDRILDAGRRAPSGHNAQPIEFIVVRDPATIKDLSSAQSCLADVSTIICIAADPSKSDFWLEDVAAATTNMLLAVTALGYASVWVEGTFLRAEKEHKKSLRVPEHMRLMVALPIGRAATANPQREKRSLQDIVHWDYLGNLKSS